MKPHDPDFPEEIPAIPDAQNGPPPADSGQHPSADLLSGPNSTPAKRSQRRPWSVPRGSKTDPESTNHPSDHPIPATHPPKPAIPAEETWTEIDEAGPEMDPIFDPRLEGSAGQKRGVEPGLGMGRSGSTDAERREAEKPVYDTLPYDDWDASEVPYQPKELGVIDQFLLLLADGATTWRKGLRWVRSLLPPSQQRQLSDELLTAILLGLLMLFLALWNPLGRRSQPSAIQGKASPGMAVVQTVEPDVVAAAPASPPLAPSLAEAPPSLEPSPEQNLIAEIQAQVSKISRSYAMGLIQSVEVNLPEQLLVVNVGSDWYGLLATQQNVVAQDIYTQAQGLALTTLQLRDPDGVVVARNPVVGSTMVVLKRSRATDADLLSA